MELLYGAGRSQLSLRKFWLYIGLWSACSLLFPHSAHAAACDQMQCLSTTTLVRGGPVAPVPTKMDGTLIDGTGLCGAFKQKGDPRLDFKQRTTNFPSDAEDFPKSINDFMDVRVADGINGARYDETLRRPFDLSNNYFTVGDDAEGDFDDSSVPRCQSRGFGCDFPASQNGNPLAGFGSRFRGFFRVYPGQENQPIHFGIFADNAVAVKIWAVPPEPANPRPLTEYLLISHGLDFSPKMRITNRITFTKAGLYPIEIVHANFDASAVLEFVVLFNHLDLQEIDQLNNIMAGQYKLSQSVPDRGPTGNRPPFDSLINGLPETNPENFFQTESGAQPYPAITACRQCPRNFADAQNQSPAVTGCEPGYFCNAAAVCSPCIGNQFCGKSCMPCGGSTPFCIPSPTDPTDASCVQCRDTPDCATGQLCVGHVCTTPDLCCPDRPFLIAPDPKLPTLKVCSPCQSEMDCGEGQKCDRANARCVAEIPECNSDDRCGSTCVDCKTVEGNRPHCLNGQVCVQCRNDFECSAGKFCLSGTCADCKADRHCGATCKSCGRALLLGSDGTSAVVQVTEKPFCYTPDDTIANADCVRCIHDSDCGPSGHCDTVTRECTNKCPEKCADGKLCDGSRCVDCYNSSQCPCGVCDLNTGTCTGTCASNQDCQGNQCCSLAPDGEHKCLPGRCAGVAGGALCGCSVASLTPPFIDNDTLDASGGDLPRSQGVLGAIVSALLCGLFLRRRLALTR